MFTVLIVANLALAIVISLLALAVFRRPLQALILKRFDAEACSIWGRYILFLIGILSVVIGTRIWDIERYVTDKTSVVISEDILVLELYRTAIATIACNAAFTVLALLLVWLVGLARRKEQ